MTSPYPLPEGCIFREDFINPKLAADNGLVITGNPWSAGVDGVQSTGSVRIMVPKLSYFWAGAGMTVVADVDVVLGSSFRSILDHSNSTSSQGFRLGISTTNKPFFYNGGTVYEPAASLSAGRRLLAWTYDLTTVNYYQDGVSLGSTSSGIARPVGAIDTALLGTRTLGYQALTARAHGISIFTRVKPASEIASDFRRIRGLKS